MANTLYETATNYVSDGTLMSFSSNERRWITKITKLAAKHPDEVRIIATPETNDGCLCVHIPKSWLKISPPKKLNLTDEQRQAAAERMRQISNT